MTQRQARSGSDAGEPQAGPIVIGYDRSEGARRAVSRAASLFPGREALVVTAWLGVADTAPELMIAPGGLLVAAVESLGDLMEERAHEVAAEGATLATGAGLLAQARTVRSHRATWEGITRCADEAAAELIVLGSRGQGALTAAILGSVSMGVLHHAERSVLLVPDGAIV
jgi:nucleotide-binding universal stress UspA family protein